MVGSPPVSTGRCVGVKVQLAGHILDWTGDFGHTESWAVVNGDNVTERVALRPKL
jgi:hypothetical protein